VKSVAQTQDQINPIEKRVKKAAKRLLHIALYKMPRFPDDGGLHELIGDVFDGIEPPVFIDLVEMLNKELVKHGFMIVRLTDTGDVDWWSVLPSSLLQSVFPNAKDPLEAAHYFNICVSLLAGWQLVLTDEEKKAIHGHCKEVERIARTILPDFYSADP